MVCSASQYMKMNTSGIRLDVVCFSFDWKGSAVTHGAE